MLAGSEPSLIEKMIGQGVRLGAGPVMRLEDFPAESASSSDRFGKWEFHAEAGLGATIVDLPGVRPTTYSTSRTDLGRCASGGGQRATPRCAPNHARPGRRRSRSRSSGQCRSGGRWLSAQSFRTVVLQNGRACFGRRGHALTASADRSSMEMSLPLLVRQDLVGKKATQVRRHRLVAAPVDHAKNVLMW